MNKDVESWLDEPLLPPTRTTPVEPLDEETEEALKQFFSEDNFYSQYIAPQSHICITIPDAKGNLWLVEVGIETEIEEEDGEYIPRRRTYRVIRKTPLT